MTDRDTKVMIVPGLACALCGGQDAPAIHLPVLTPDGQPRFPRVCEHCVSVFGAVFLQLLGHAGDQVAAIAVAVHNTGHPPLS